MKITKIEKEKGIFTVTLTPNCIEKLFGVKEKEKRFKETESNFTFGGGNVYLNEKGEKLDNGDYIGVTLDNWQRAFWRFQVSSAIFGFLNSPFYFPHFCTKF